MLEQIQIRKKTRKINLLATGIVISAGLAVTVLILGSILMNFIDVIYSNTLTPDQLVLIKELYIILVVNISLILFKDVFVGTINGYEQYIYTNSVKVIRLLLRVIIIITLLSMGTGALALVLCDLSLTILFLICDIWFCFCKLKLKAKFHKFDKILIKSIATFAAAVILQVFVNQVNQNLDSVILGAMVTPELVAVYSLALTIYVAFNSLSSSIGSLFSPEAARRVQLNQTKQEIQNFTIKVGRYQFLVIALVLGGFISCGINFVQLWVGSGKDDVYYLALILMIPMAFANTLSGANSVLDGYMKRMGRSIILVATAILNIITSIVMIKIIGYWGAALGTAWSVIVGQIILLSFHYHRVFGFSFINYFSGILKGIFPSMALAVSVTMVLQMLPLGNLMVLFLKILVYLAIYSFGIMMFKSNYQEKLMIKGMLTKLKLNRC